MNATIFKYSLLAAIVLIATGTGIWYFVAPPEITPEQTPASKEAPGIIEGTTLYPSDFNPAQRVCAQSIDDPNYERCVDVPEQTSAEAPTFSIKVAPGTYYVYATLKDPSELGLQEEVRAYWTDFVACGLIANCPSHTKIPVLVEAGQTVSDIGPHDWYSTE
jgi:hypothetical protein